MPTFNSTPNATMPVPSEISKSHAEVMQGLSLMLNQIGDVVPRGAEIAYLDVPLHFNVGDQLINLGAEAFFKRMDYKVSVRMSLFDLCHIDWISPRKTTLKDSAVRRLKVLNPGAILVLHGGGNFGDIYPEYQIMRELIVEAFPERRVVLLPQSMHFSSPAEEQASLRRLFVHKDLHICVRDVESRDALRRLVPNAGILLPDMAHALWATPGWEPANSATKKTLVLRRTDSETAEGIGGAAADVTEFDWPSMVTSTDNLLFRVIRRAMAGNMDPSYKLPMAGWYRLRDYLVRRAINIFGQHTDVVTDRLHGMILASLLSQRLQFADNSYGKLSRYVGAWLHESPLISQKSAPAKKQVPEAVAA
jgi:pyruvyl transferase EpsO